MIKIMKPGLETSIQDYPGRLGYRNQGFPVSGPFDSWSFRLANLLVGNQVGEAALEVQFTGPELYFEKDIIFSITGANMKPLLGNKKNQELEKIPMNKSIQAKKGQTLLMHFPKIGIRSYIAFEGGIDTEPWLDSQSTFHKAGVGGINGSAIKKGDLLTLKTNNNQSTPDKKIKEGFLPIINSKNWEIEVVAGPNDDWIDEAGHERFLTSPWKLDAKSDRTGFRLQGPEWTFTSKATNKLPENGSDPANIIDQGYPTGAINLAGQTPIILVSDGPSMGGFICPYTVPSCAFYKLAQSKPGDIYNFKKISVQKSQEIMKDINKKCSIDAIE